MDGAVGHRHEVVARESLGRERGELLARRGRRVGDEDPKRRREPLRLGLPVGEERRRREQPGREVLVVAVLDIVELIDPESEDDAVRLLGEITEQFRQQAGTLGTVTFFDETNVGNPIPAGAMPVYGQNGAPIGYMIANGTPAATTQEPKKDPAKDLPPIPTVDLSKVTA